MRKVDIDTNNGQVAGTIENHYSLAKAGPPEGHPNGRSCPQCAAVTWRMTQWCIHCGADLFAIDQHERQRRATTRKATISGAGLLISAIAWWIQSYVPHSWKAWVIGFGVFALLVAAAATKD